MYNKRRPRTNCCTRQLGTSCGILKLRSIRRSYIFPSTRSFDRTPSYDPARHLCVRVIESLPPGAVAITYQHKRGRDVISLPCPRFRSRVVRLCTKPSVIAKMAQYLNASVGVKEQVMPRCSTSAGSCLLHVSLHAELAQVLVKRCGPRAAVRSSWRGAVLVQRCGPRGAVRSSCCLAALVQLLAALRCV